MGTESVILGLVGQYGLPLVILVVVGWYCLKKLDAYFDSQREKDKAQQKKDEENRQYLVERIEKSEVRQEELTKIGRELSETNRTLVERFTSELGCVKKEVTEIGSKVDIINVKLDKK